MTDRIELGRLGIALRALGLAIWSFVGVQRLLEMAHHAGLARGWIYVWLAYGAAFCATAMPRVPDFFVGALLVSQTATALAMPWLGRAGFEGLMLAIVAAEAASVVSARSAVLYAGVQLVVLIVDVAPMHTLHEVIEIGGAYSTFAVFALTTTWLFRREARARSELARMHAALLSAQDRLAESSRTEERLRIARELHDTMGHHLAAMSIQLDLASRTTEGPAAEVLKTSHATSRKLLGEVRAVVSAMRDDAPVDLRAALASLGEGIRSPEVHCTVDDAVSPPSPRAARALFRCAQEAVTNALRHASAQHVWIDLKASGDVLVLAIRDDGRGSARIEPGSGLRGMRERFAELGGEVDFGTAGSGGFEVRATLPIATEGGSS